MSGLDLTAMDHVAYAVADLPAAISEFELLGFTVLIRAELVELGVEIAMLVNGEQRTELVRPLDAEQGRERRAERGIRLDHVAYRVADIDATVAVLGELGMELVGPDERRLHAPLELGGSRQVWTRLGDIRLQLIEPLAD